MSFNRSGAFGTLPGTEPNDSLYSPRVGAMIAELTQFFGNRLQQKILAALSDTGGDSDTQAQPSGSGHFHIVLPDDFVLSDDLVAQQAAAASAPASGASAAAPDVPDAPAALEPPTASLVPEVHPDIAALLSSALSETVDSSHDLGNVAAAVFVSDDAAPGHEHLLGLVFFAAADGPASLMGPGDLPI